MICDLIFINNNGYGLGQDLKRVLKFNSWTSV